MQGGDDVKWCTACKKPIDDKDVIRQPERSEEDQARLEEFASQIPGGTAPPKPEIKEYHMRSEIKGRRRKGVIGGFRPTQVRCGPLRDAEPGEFNAWVMRE